MSSISRTESILLAMVAAACFVAGPAPAVAQSGRKPQGRQTVEKPVVRLETREVVIPVRAYDADGRFVDDLTERDVLVMEEGEPRPVTAIRREPANIVLLLDLSNEIGTFKNGPTRRYARDERPVWEDRTEYRPFAKPTTRELAESLISRMSPTDNLAVIQYADKPQVIQDWTSDRRQALNAIASKYRVGVRSAFYDALRLASEKLQSRPGGRRVLVIVSDGIDSSSKASRSQALAALSKTRASVFVIGWAEALRNEILLAMGWIRRHESYNTASARRLAELGGYLPQLEAAAAALRDLAESSGGEIWLPSDHEQMLAAWQPMVAEIGAQYSLSFVTERKPSLEDLRSIQVLPARRGLSLRSRRTYYAGGDAGTGTE